MTTIEVVVENARRYDKIAVMPRKDLEMMVRLTGKAIVSLAGVDGMLALINDTGLSVEATPVSNVVADGASQLEDAAEEDKPLDGVTEPSPTDGALTEEELRAIGVDPDNEEQLAALGLIVQGSD